MNKKTPNHHSETPGEFELIRRFFCSGFPPSAHTRIGIGDDASIVQPPAHHELIQSIDTQVADVHFPASAPARLIAQRALRCAVSDLAAMGATPQGFHLALTLPQANASWLEDFARGLKQAASELNISLLGGDTTRGKQLVISIAVQGWVTSGRALTRHQAQAGDQLYLSGPIGAAALALEQVLQHPADDSGLVARYYYPEVHLALGQALIGVASACLDVSDGLIQDAGHIARASALTVNIEALSVNVTDVSQRSQCLTGGDDYQLLFSSSDHQAIRQLQQQFPGIHAIGQCQPGAAVVNVQGLELQHTGFSHF